jgi:hypothetical protein
MFKKMPNASNLLYTMLVAVFLIGCESPKGENIVNTGKDYNIKTIDSCEYIEVDYGFVDNRVYSLTHKGNCKFCLSRHAK